MKRIFTIISLVILMIACDIGPRDANAYGPEKQVFKWIYQSSWKKDGLEYLSFRVHNNGGIFIVNHTRELLEVEKLKRELGYE